MPASARREPPRRLENSFEQGVEIALARERDADVDELVEDLFAIGHRRKFRRGGRPVSAQTLGVVQRPVGGDDEIVDGRGVFRQAGDAEAGGDRRVREAVLLDDVPDTLRVRETAAFDGVHQDDRELVAPVARDDAEASRVLHQELGDVAQHLVPGAVAEAIVDFLEVVEIQQGERQRLAEAADA